MKKVKLRDYQRKGVQQLVDAKDAFALFQCPGLGKTLQTLLAYEFLRSQDKAKKMLVVAPLQVARTVWNAEAAKWDATAHLNVIVLHGSAKAKRLQKDHDIAVINYEGLKWLEHELKGKPWPWDIIVYDELTKTKSVNTQRARWIKRNHESFDRHWGLTGTPMSTKGFEDLFGQIRSLDGGVALGHRKDIFVDTFFYYKSLRDRNLYLKPGASDIITRRISPIVYRLSASDHLAMPDKVTCFHDIVMEKEHWEIYDELERDMALRTSDLKEITAVSAGVLWGKLLQVVQGFSYTDCRDVVWHSHAKIEKLQSLVEESAGAPILVFYHFKAEVVELCKHFPNAVVLGRNRTEETIDQWNNNEIELLLASPLSAGHGINLQLGGAHIIVWYCQNGSPEIYIQANGRLWRQGQKKESVIIHHLNMVTPSGSTIDDDIITMLKNRTSVQDVMLRRLSALQSVA